MIFTPSTTLSDVIFSNPATIAVLNRFGIKLGVGRATIQDICRERELDLGFMLMLLNTYVNDDYIPSKEYLHLLDIGLLIGYLEQTDIYYARIMLPNIEFHLNTLISRSEKGSNNLEHLRCFYLEMKKELETRSKADIDWFAKLGTPHYKADESEIRRMTEVDVMIEEKVGDLLRFFVEHLRGDYNQNLCHAVVTAVFAFDKDVKQNNRLRSLLIGAVKNNL